MIDIVLGAPMAGWVSALDAVPDPVFAEGMMGPGLAIEPLSGDLVAPCDGTVASVAATGHAVTLRIAEGTELLIHFGVDTVALGGAGFTPHVRAGDFVRAGQPLLTADLDHVARHAPSVITPLVLLGDGLQLVSLMQDRRVAAGEPIARVSGQAPGEAPNAAAGSETRRTVRVPLVHGIHARPAARIVAALKPFTADVIIERGEDRANARSVTALLGANITSGQEVAILACGADAPAAADAVAALIGSGMGEHGRDAAAAPRTGPGATTEAPSRGICAVPGFAVGPLFQLRLFDAEVSETGAGPAAERATLDRARAMARASLEAADLAEAHRALLDDPELVEEAHRLVETGKSAAYAWRAASRARAAILRALSNPMLVERAADILDIERQLIAAMTGGPAALPGIPPGAIVVADELLPSQIPALADDGAAGFCTALGGPTSHAAILASSRGLPMVVAAGREVLELADGLPALLDADGGRLVLLSGEQLSAASDEAARRASARDAAIAAAQALCRTADGTRIEVAANLAGPADAATAVTFGAEGCGLLRTEFLFMDRTDAPSEDEQAAAYREIATALGDRPLIVRTLDVGGDKPLAYLPFAPEENPALGLRGIRFSLARPDLLRTQLRAILRGVPAEQRRIMLPMVIDVGELRTARAALDAAAAELGQAPGPLGVMIETPAAALLAPELAREADFLSIGSNDLTQYALAADRGNSAVASLIDPLHPAVLRLVAQANAGARAHGRWLGICGGVASDPRAVPILIGLGATEFSATPAAVPAVKAAVAAITMDAARALAAQTLACATAAEVRSLLETVRCV